MTAAEIRQSFLDFFREKQHTIVPSASLLPQSPGLLFTNAGMNQFVPYFLGTDKAPYDPPRAADTQKCIRAGGKHNDLEDVGYDTYHHTMFEMLGNWSFGNYFKKEAIAWAWELVIERWGLPANRLYASVYAPKPGDPGQFDQEAWDIWAELFRSKGVDPEIHIVHGNVKDNFWMMGETGPCGPCSELHVDLTPNGDSKGKLVNNDSDLCIEIWNLVFIQYNAEADGSFRELPAKHVDTGMGFERACSIIQGTKRFTDFSNKPSNYATDVFTPIFRKLEELSGKTYVNIYPELGADRSAFTEEMKTAIAFRVIADHLRTLSFSIADGIMPGNNGRNYVLRRILRRAVRYGRQLGFSGEKPFFAALVPTLVEEMGGVFPELKNRQATIEQTLAHEEDSFNGTLENGLATFEEVIACLNGLSERVFEVSVSINLSERGQHAPALEDLKIVYMKKGPAGWSRAVSVGADEFKEIGDEIDRITALKEFDVAAAKEIVRRFENRKNVFPGRSAFMLADTFGFPIDLTELLCAERGMKVDMPRFEELMEQQREQSRSSQKKTVVRASSIAFDFETEFIGYEVLEANAVIRWTSNDSGKNLMLIEPCPFYATMGGQEGDTGWLIVDGHEIEVLGTTKIGNVHLLELGPANCSLLLGKSLKAVVDQGRRQKIEAHHTATHLLHWALHEAVSKDAAQQGSSVDENRLRFDFNSAPVTQDQIAAMEDMVNGAIKQGLSVSWTEVKHADIKGRTDIMQFFGDKYGDTVRVVQIGGEPHQLNGPSMELCGGTHVRNTSEIGLFKIKSEGAIASGVRRIEAVCGEAAWSHLHDQAEKWRQEYKAAEAKLTAANEKLAALGETPITVNEFPHIMAAMLVERADINEINAVFAHGARTLEETQQAAIEAEKRIKKIQSSQAAKLADEALSDLIAKGEPIIASFESDASLLQELQNGLKKKNFPGPALLIVDDGEKLHLATHCGPDALAKGLKAGDLLRDLAALAGGKGGGKPDQARGAAPQREKLAELKMAAAGMLFI